MKKLVLILLFLGLMAGVGSADYLGPNKDIQVTSGQGIVNQVFSQMNTIYAVTPEAGTYIGGVDIQAVSSEVRMLTDGSAWYKDYWSIPQNSTKSSPSNMITIFPAGKTFYFYVPTTGTIPAMVQIHYFKY